MNNEVYFLADNYSLYQGDFKSKKLFLFDIVEGSIFRLNEVSYDMLALFNGERSLQQVISTLASIYEVEISQLESDLNNMLERWVERRVLIKK